MEFEAGNFDVLVIGAGQRWKLRLVLRQRG